MKRLRSAALVAATVLCLAPAAAVLCLAPVAARAQPFTAKFGLATLDDAQNVWCDRYAAMLEKDSQGRIKARVYPDSQLGAIPRMIEETQFGAIQLWMGPPEFLFGVDPRFQVLSAPGVFKSFAQANRVVQDPSFVPAFLAVGEHKGLVGVGIFVSGPEAFVMRTPVHDIAGFAGMKIRVLASAMQTEQIRALKATPVPMSLGELMPALQQGALDGVMATAPTFVPLKFMTVAKYLVETEQAMTTSIGVVSGKWLNSLPPDLRRIVIEDGAKVSREIVPTAGRLLDESFGGWEKGGGQVIRLDAAEHARLQALMEPVAERVVAQDPAVGAMFSELQAALERSK